MLYKRDYNKLSTQEQKTVEKFNSIFSPGKPITAEQLNSTPSIFYIYNSCFPNNFLTSDLLRTKEGISIYKDFNKLVKNVSTGELKILNFIKNNEAYFIVQSLLRYYDFGNHGSYLFREFELTGSYVADFLLIGENSHGHHFVFIEFESPYGSITLKEGEFGEVIRKGINQVEDWDSWIDNNFSSLEIIFEKYKNPRKDLPQEFHKLDKTRIHFMVVAGRRTDFLEKTNLKRRKLAKESNITMLHYDNLLDSVDQLIEYKNTGIKTKI